MINPLASEPAQEATALEKKFEGTSVGCEIGELKSQAVSTTQTFILYGSTLFKKADPEATTFMPVEFKEVNPRRTGLFFGPLKLNLS